MVKDKEDWHGLQTTNLKNLGENFQDAKTRDVAHLTTGVWLVTESLKRRVLCDGPNKDRKFLSLLKFLQVTLNFSFNRSYFPRDPSKHWANVGCHKNYSTEQYTICHCYHLTSYGLIMDVHGIYVRYTLSTPHSPAFL